MLAALVRCFRSILVSLGKYGTTQERLIVGFHGWKARVGLRRRMVWIEDWYAIHHIAREILCLAPQTWDAAHFASLRRCTVTGLFDWR